MLSWWMAPARILSTFPVHICQTLKHVSFVRTVYLCQSIYDTEAVDAHENSKMKQIKLHVDRESDTRQLGN